MTSKKENAARGTKTSAALTNTQCTHSNANSTDAQCQRLISELRAGPITTVRARHQLDVLHVAGRIQNLRARGHEIVTTMVKDFTAPGKPHRVAQYALIAEARGHEING